MSEERTEPLSFGEQLLGMQGFDAARAQRYRAEMEKLLVHRISRFERWTLAFAGVWIAVALIVGGIAMASIKSAPQRAAGDFARWSTSIGCIVTGALMGAWLVRIAIQGGYARRVGDVMGLLIAASFCGGWGVAFLDLAWNVTDAVLRMKLLCMGGLMFVVLTGACLLAVMQRMHRQTQEKLLRVEYHAAELMERLGGGKL
jgi:hypothetical protein